MDKWISVKDRLPDENDDVLFLCRGEIILGGWGTYNDNYEQGGNEIMFWVNKCECKDYEPIDVTHWMPLPELPKESNNE